ncbi:HDOD domain-containing protein [Campylobacter sp. US33a]|uniref:HDOD domain-containing protein n=1 Tax=Campylobacter sp. CCS1377 TaxID=3158229 RepID=A0AAU7EBN6_9BACT|nr:HDOD domain-containing protein [Campylobacter sp. US33a]MCW1360347.1 HDOD domain-containing protein [Campylobacter jejuni]TEY04658.1 HDOD domain-containing protein [Campylobacter sp. US33a]
MRHDMNEKLLKSVETLPPLPETIHKLKKYIDEERTNIQTDKVAQIIQADPLVTAKLLQLANSPFYGFSREVKTINQVVTLFGINNIKNIILADSIRSNFTIDVSPYGLDTQKFIQTCNEEAGFISEWLLEEDKQLSYLLVPCAMLLRLGMIIFSNFLIQNHKDKEFLETLKQNNFRDITMIENQFLGVDHLSFLGFLFYRWDFDEILIESICFANTPHSASDEIKKNAYALAAVNCIFAPYNGGSVFNSKKAISLLKEANGQGMNFNIDHFIAKLPQFAKVNLNSTDDEI